MTQQWNVAQTNSAITLSGSPALTATRQAGTADAVGFALESVTAGKFYWEETLTVLNQIASGIGNTSSAFASSYLGQASDSMGYYSTGTVYNNGAVVTVLSGFGSVVLCTALDLTTNKIWWRPGITADWNNAAIGSQDPATNTGGVSIVQAGMTIIANPVVPGLNLFATNDALTVAFDQSSWQGVAPSGFGPFDTAGGAVFSDTSGAGDFSLAARSGNERQRTVWWS